MEISSLRAFLRIAELGSLNRAAEQSQVAQSTLTRQMQALEQELGTALFERRPTGVVLTAAGHHLRKELTPLLARLETVTAEVRRQGQGESQVLRVGYLLSAAAALVHPVLARWRKEHPEVRVKLHDLSPGEQMRALRQGELDLAVLGHAGKFLTREFYVRRLFSAEVRVVLPADHPLAGVARVDLPQLSRELWVSAVEEDMPGVQDWMTRHFRRAGFRPRWSERSVSMMDGFATVVTEGAAMLLPAYTERLAPAGVVMKPLSQTGLSWDFYVVWQRGKASEALKTLRDLICSSCPNKDRKVGARD